MEVPISDAMNKAVSAFADAFSYRGRLAAGGIVYLTGWAVWFVSLWLPAAYVSRGAAYPLGTWFYVGAGLLDLIGHTAAFTFTFSVALVAVYFMGLAAAIISLLFRSYSPVRLTAKVFTLGVLVGCCPGWLYLNSYQGFDPICLGLPALGLGGLLICIGTWLIPPRQNGGKAAGKVEEPRAASDTNRASLVGATVLAAGWVLLLFALFVPGYQPAGADI